jgi:hypothetical protein
MLIVLDVQADDQIAHEIQSNDLVGPYSNDRLPNAKTAQANHLASFDPTFIRFILSMR